MTTDERNNKNDVPEIENDEQKNENHKVIKLPTRMNQHHEAKQRLQGQRFAAAISLGSVIMISLFLNQFLTQNQSNTGHSGANADSGNRFIASLPENQRPENLKWESKMATELSTKSLPVISAQKPKSSDQLLFGELRGQYAAVLNDQFKISKLQLIGDGQFVISDFQQFLVSKRQLFSIDFDSARDAGEIEGVLKYKLFKASKEVGEVTIERNAFGNLKSLEFQ